METQPTSVGFQFLRGTTAPSTDMVVHTAPPVESAVQQLPTLPRLTEARSMVPRLPPAPVGEGGTLAPSHLHEVGESKNKGGVQTPLSLGFLTQHVERILDEREKRVGNSPPNSTIGSVRFEKPQSHVPQGGVPMVPFGIGTPMGVGVVGVGGANPFAGMMGYPHMAQMWAEITKPTLFEAKPSQWDQFDREWRKYEQLTTATGFPMPDLIKLSVLK